MLDFQDTQIDARVVGVAKRMPSVPAELGSFVLADEGWLSTALDAGSPGEGTPQEVWISGDAGASAPAGPPSPTSSSPRGPRMERRLAGDPLAHATSVALGAAASSR